MGDAEFVPRTECALHRELVETKLAANERRIDGMEDKIDQILIMQKNTLISIISILVVCMLILIGVVLGRGVDFGMILAAV